MFKILKNSISYIILHFARRQQYDIFPIVSTLMKAITNSNIYVSFYIHKTTYTITSINHFDNIMSVVRYTQRFVSKHIRIN